jgi:Zn-dependent oligopeptidase
LSEDKSHIIVKKSELAGLPEDYISSLSPPEKNTSVSEKDDDPELVVTTQYPHAFPLLRQCSVEETRRKFVLFSLFSLSALSLFSS